MEELKIHPSWKIRLQEEFDAIYFKKLKQFLIEEDKQFQILPPENQIFTAFDYTPFDKLKVVIIGQDPYHGIGQANGLCFSVNDHIKKPPSLLNIFKELEQDLGFSIPISGNLESWAHEGVLLLNATLTVRLQQAGSHQKKGWENFTDAVIKLISEQKENIVFMLWGNFAQSKAGLINSHKHLILAAAHPSPLARGAFFGNKHFSKTNEYLQSKGIEPINWEIN